MDGNSTPRIRCRVAPAHGFNLAAADDECLSDSLLRRLGKGNVESHHRTAHSGHESAGLQTWRARGAVSKSVVYFVAEREGHRNQRRSAGRLARMVRQL